MTTDSNQPKPSNKESSLEDSPSKDANHFDSGYKELFSYPELVQQLIEGFAPPELAQMMDFSKLKQHNGHYITPLFEEKREDLVWSVEVEWGKTRHLVYLYLLLDKFIGNEFGRTSVRPKDECQGRCSSISIEKRYQHGLAYPALCCQFLQQPVKKQRNQP